MATKRAIKTLLVIATLFAISSSALLYGQGQEPPGSPTQSARLDLKPAKVSGNYPASCIIRSGLTGRGRV